jgi:hypothetical protein
MEITIKGEPKEIAALVLAIQERRDSVGASDVTGIIASELEQFVGKAN